MKSRICIFRAEDYRTYLKQVLDERRERNPRYSLRAFARDLDAAPSLLSLVIHNKSGLSLDKAQNIAERLAIPDYERAYFVALVYKDRTGDESLVLQMRREHAYHDLHTPENECPRLSLNEFAFYLTMSLTGKIKISECQDRFGIDREEFYSFTRKLERLGWLEGSDEEGWAAVKGFMRTESFDRSESIRLFHQNILDLAQRELHEGDVGKRYFFSTVFTLAQDDYQELCQLLGAFCQSKSDAYATRSRHDRIYAVGLQVLPVARVPQVTALSR